MIKLPDGELRDYLPPSMKNDVDMACLSYALKKATERVLAYQKQAMVYNFIDILPEQICDVMAVELRSPYYSDSMDIGIKRNIVKNSLVWHMKAGTPAAVNEMIKAVFGEGEIVEWPDFDEPPYTPGTFDIVTSAQMTEKGIDQILSVIERVKNKRSHIRRVLVKRRTDQELFAGTGQFPVYKLPVITEKYSMLKKAWQKLYTGTKQFSIHKPPAVTEGCNRLKETGQNLYIGAGQFLAYKPPAILDGYKISRKATQDIYVGTGEASHMYQSTMEFLNFESKIRQPAKSGTATAAQEVKPSAVVDSFKKTKYYNQRGDNNATTI